MLDPPSLYVSSACYADFAVEDIYAHSASLCQINCILMMMITGIGGKEMRFPVRHWTMYVYASKPFEFAPPYSLMPGTMSAHVIVQSFHRYTYMYTYM